MRYVFIFLVFFSTSNAMAETAMKIDSTAKVKPMKLDSSSIRLRKIDEEAISNYSKQKEFIYDDVAPKTMSWWDRFWRSFWDFIRRIFSSDGKSSGKFTGFVKYFTIAAAVAILVFVIVKLLKLDLRLLFGKSKEVEVPYEESLENIHEIDFDEQLERAMLNKNYRLAIRLLYLKTLKRLSDQQLIDWQPGKTNQKYVAELTDENQKQTFEALTYQFEYVWYGDFPVDKDNFEIISHSFLQFKNHTK